MLDRLHDWLFWRRWSRMQPGSWPVSIEARSRGMVALGRIGSPLRNVHQDAWAKAFQRALPGAHTGRVFVFSPTTRRQMSRSDLRPQKVRG